MTLIELKKSVDAALAAGTPEDAVVLFVDASDFAVVPETAYAKVSDSWGPVFTIREES